MKDNKIVKMNIVKPWGICMAHCPYCKGSNTEHVFSNDPEEKKEQLERFRVYHNEYHFVEDGDKKAEANNVIQFGV